MDFNKLLCSVFVCDMWNPVYSCYFFKCQFYFHIDWECDTTFIEQIGTFESPRYPDNYPTSVNCKTLIKAPEGSTVVLDILDFSLELDGNTEGLCESNWDTFRVHDGEDDSAPLLGEYCGELIPEMFTSSGEHLFVVFTSDSSATERGYQATFHFKEGTMKAGFLVNVRVGVVSLT